MCQIIIQNGAQKIQLQAEPGALLSDLLRQAIPAFALPCGGNHTCGKCRVKLSGHVPAPTDSDRHLLREQEIALLMAERGK